MYPRILNKIYLFIKNSRTVPRWIIFMLDLVVCNFALLYAYLLRFNLDFQEVKDHGIVAPVIVVTLLNVLFFLVFKTYEGIIRLSSLKEALRCVFAVACSSFVLLLFIFVSELFESNYLVPSSVTIIYFFVASFLIFSYRLIVKELYKYSRNSRYAKENIFICGRASFGASFIKNAIESIHDHHYVVAGFIDTDENYIGKSIDNVKIYSFENAKSVLQKLGIKVIFINSDDIDLKSKNEIVDYCLQEEIAVKVIPAAQKWIKGQLKTKQIKDVKIEDLLNRPSIELAPDHIIQDLKGKRVLITGAAGSIGSEIVKQVAKIDVEQLILCDNRETGIYELQYELEQLKCNMNNIVISISDVRHCDVMERLFDTYRPEIVFHAAAYKHVPLMEMHPCQAIINNVKGTKIVGNLSVKYGVQRFVFISTDKAINPTNIMGASKRIAEMFIAQLQCSQGNIEKADMPKMINEQGKISRENQAPTKFITTRFGNVLGSNGSVIPRFRSQIDSGGPVTVTHPDITRYFMTIPEACSLVLEAGTMGRGGEIFVFDMGEPVRIADLAHKMIKLAGFIPNQDIQIEYSGLRPGEKLYEELLNKSEAVAKTHHKKIMISKVDNSISGTIFDSIDFLLELAEQNKVDYAVKQMKYIVPEYKSKNSDFEKFDIIENSSEISISA